MFVTIKTLLKAVAAAGPMGWIALVVIAALALSAFGISAMLEIAKANGPNTP